MINFYILYTPTYTHTHTFYVAEYVVFSSLVFYVVEVICIVYFVFLKYNFTSNCGI